MRVLIQRVTSASVTVAGEEIANIDHGLLALVGIASGDNKSVADWLAEKMLGLRIFPDELDPNINMNRSLMDVGGKLLVVSQFTLTADVQKGKRPSFTTSATPDVAQGLYNHFVDYVAQRVPTQTGKFGADMQVALVNDGPVTFLLERNAD